MAAIQYYSEVAMPLYKRFLWGLLAGIAVICVKLLGPDIEHFRSLVLTGNMGETVFYGLISAITVFLGGVSGLFSKDSDPSRILIFCASFPALVTTAFAPDRIPANINPDRPAEQAEYRGPKFALPSPISVARAQDLANEGFCDEGSFISQFTKAATEYFASNRLEANSYVVIVGSTTDFSEAKSIADGFAERTDRFPVYVGCRKPGNDYFPIVIGEPSNAETAAGIKGLITGEGWAPADSYISSYQYREPIYIANPS